MKKIILLGVFLVLIFKAVLSIATETATEKVFYWTKEGVSPFWRTPLRSEEDLKNLFNNKDFKSKLIKRLEVAESEWNAYEIVSILENKIKRKEYEYITIEPKTPESEFEWMLYGEKGLTGKTIWAGEHNLKGYLISFNYQGERHEILFANKCVNILKKKKKPEPAPGKTEYQQQTIQQPPPVVNNYYYNYQYTSPPPPPPPQPTIVYSPPPPPQPTIVYNTPPPVYQYYELPPRYSTSYSPFFEVEINIPPLVFSYQKYYKNYYHDCYHDYHYRHRHYYRPHHRPIVPYYHFPPVKPPVVHTKPPAVHTKAPAVRPPGVRTR